MRIANIGQDKFAFTGKKLNAKKINRAALPTISGLGILAGSSMSGQNIPPNAGKHVPGSSVDDSVWDQIKHVGEMAKDAGKTIVEEAKDSFDDLLDVLDDIF